jgi:SAM-dependent methyltransferase
MSDQTPWHEDDRLWEVMEPFFFNPDICQVAAVEVDGIMALLDLDSNGSILDLCCGIGRHTLELARRGYRVTGVDRTTRYLDAAGRHAQEENLTIEFVHDDMRRFRRVEEFDGVINIQTSFGYFDDPSDERRVMDNIYASLKPGGRLIMEMLGKEILARTYRPRDWQERDGRFMLVESIPENDWAYIKNRRIVIYDGKTQEFTLKLRLFSAFELTSLIREAGFKTITCFGGLDKSPYDEKAKRLVAMAQK